MTPSAAVQQSAIFDHMVKQIMEPQSNLIRANVQDRISEIDEIIGCYQRFGTNHNADIARLLAEREQLTGGRIEGGAIVIGEEQ